MWASSLLLSCPFKTLLLMSSSFSSNCFCCSLAYSTARRNLLKIFHSLQFCLLAFFIFLILGWALASAWLLALCLQVSSSVPSLVFPGISQKKTPDQPEMTVMIPFWNPSLKHLSALWSGLVSFLSWNHWIYHFHQWCVLVSLCFPGLSVVSHLTFNLWVLQGRELPLPCSQSV